MHLKIASVAMNRMGVVVVLCAAWDVVCGTLLSSDRPKAGFQRLWLSYLLLVCETKILYTK